MVEVITLELLNGLKPYTKGLISLMQILPSHVQRLFLRSVYKLYVLFVICNLYSFDVELFF